MLPEISPSPLTSLKEPIGHPNWVFELKHDGFRGAGSERNMVESVRD
jgi:ATP-dependent DNA ligase